jgi:hypothetical protein
VLPAEIANDHAIGLGWRKIPMICSSVKRFFI